MSSLYKACLQQLVSEWFTVTSACSGGYSGLGLAGEDRCTNGQTCLVVLALFCSPRHKPQGKLWAEQAVSTVDSEQT